MKDTHKLGKSTDQEGQALVEFALVAIFLVIVIFGIIDFARLFFSYASMSNGAREGARYGIIHPTDTTGIEERARGMLEVLGETATVTITYPGRDDGSDPGCTDAIFCRIRVRVEATLDVWTPILPSMNLEAQSTMHFE